MAEFLMRAGSAFEAEIVRERLLEAGIHVLVAGEAYPRATSVAERDLYVEEAELDRAREVLKEAQEVDEDELTRLSQEGAETAPEGHE